FDGALHEALAEVIDVFADGELAVRSSAVGEDGASHSFAGQFKTVLHVRGADALADAVRECCASASSAHALAYHDRQLDMAVIIQRMIDGDASGVVFTTDPVSGDSSRVRVNACRGLGDKLVSGEIDADEIVTDRAGVALDQQSMRKRCGRSFVRPCRSQMPMVRATSSGPSPAARSGFSNRVR